MRLQLDEAKAAAANAVSEYQCLEEMAMLKQTLHLVFLGDHLVDQIIAWRAEHRAAHPLVNECLAFPVVARPLSLAIEPLTIHPPPPEVHPDQVIEDDPRPTVRAAESDVSIE